MRTAAVLLASLAVAAPAGAAEPKTSMPDVEDEVMCVTCNVPLNIAESPQASRQRAFIRRLVDDGLTKDEVKARLVDEYGEDVLALPDEDGVGAAAYVVPIVIVLAMIALAAFLLPRWRRPTAPVGSAGGPAVSDAELKRLDDDLARFD